MICIYTGDQCKARVGPRPALYHHFCYSGYCEQILKIKLHDGEDCNECLDCRYPKTVVAAVDALPAVPKRGRGGKK